MQGELSTIASHFAQLREEHEALETRYARCTTSVGTVVLAHPTSSAWTTTEIRRGQSIGFGLTDSRVTITVIRVTADGIVVRVNGCLDPGILEPIRSPPDGRNAFVITLSLSLVMSVSSECCRRGFVVCDLSDVEDIHIELIRFDVDEQLSTLRYRRR